MQGVQWGEYRLGDLFEIERTLSFNTEKLVFGNQYDYVTRTSLSQGILQTTGFINVRNINDAGCWSLGLLQMDFFYRKKQWYAGQFVRKITPKIEVTKGSIPFFTTILNQQKKTLLSVLVRNVDKTFREIIVQLPTKNNKIDFDFMENFIAELEARHIAELEAYLSITGLKEYTLTKEEQNVLQEFDTLNWQQFKIGDLFAKLKVNTLKYKTSELPNDATIVFNLPALTAGIQNQGLNNFVPRDNATLLKNVISISANGANTGATFYQSKEFTVLQDAYAIEYTEKKLTDNQYLFLTSCISKTIFGNYEWTNKAGWEKVKNERIALPIKDGQIDFDLMQLLISAIQKLVIKDVVEYSNNKIDTTKNVVEYR